MTENLTEVDLWGNRVYVRAGKRGRPPFERTEENARKVSMLLALGWSNERICGCIRDPRTGRAISEPTLKRYFRPELQERSRARDRLVARQVEVALTAAFDGNVGAMRMLDKLIEKNDMMLAEAWVAKRAEAPKDDPKPERLGKKEIDARLAEDADAALMAELDLEARGRARH